MEERCEDYCGVACVNGSCPLANMEEYLERGYEFIHSCDLCPYYKGCEDCYFNCDEMYCPKEINGRSEH